MLRFILIAVLLAFAPSAYAGSLESYIARTHAKQIEKPGDFIDLTQSEKHPVVVIFWGIGDPSFPNFERVDPEFRNRVEHVYVHVPGSFKLTGPKSTILRDAYLIGITEAATFIDGYPSIVAYRNRKVVARYGGFFRKKELRAFFDKLLQKPKQK